ncbi:Hypothetical predicted protein [Olea europaea subsp. europaea]|uniref:Uncharacterized protein n=1 Tax=Olea europaea subsp. europaea TaxID=158383 RepID=A0A8S0Q6C5_OLEEU|nr:Hypothetical predicted protein [Olea europaea subsp. europaea]
MLLAMEWEWESSFHNGVIQLWDCRMGTAIELWRHWSCRSEDDGCRFGGGGGGGGGRQWWF